jgi:hypothetical protein
MSDEQAVKQVWEDAHCVQIIRGMWNVVYGDDPEHPGYANIVEPAELSEDEAWKTARSKVQPAVPVEERTQDNAQNLRYATQIAEYLHKNCYPEVTQWKPISGDLFGVLMQIDNMCTGVQRKPKPEERTAEMELGPAIIEAIGALRSSYNVQDFPGDGDTRQDHAANALERIWDHIEGKGK